MNYYIVSVIETRQANIPVKAESKEKAEEIIKDIYKNGGIILADDFSDVVFEICEG